MLQNATAEELEAGSKLPLDALKKMWETSRPLGELILKSGLSRTRLYKLAAFHKWQRAADYEITGKVADDPSEEEIAQRAAEIRANWSEAETERRWRGKKREDVYTRTLTYHPESGVFSNAPPCRY